MAANGEAKVKAEQTKAELAEAARWGRCPSCHLDKPLNEERTALRSHRRYVEVVHAPGEIPGLMIGCSGVGQPPASLAVDFIEPNEDG